LSGTAISSLTSAIASKGLHWETVEHLKALDGKGDVHSVRLNQKMRALALPDGDLMRFISLHPDHDSAYA
jgi:hypothetical protein